MSARDWHFFRHFLHDANPPYTPEEIERYVEAWSQPGAAAGMINYYRAEPDRDDVPNLGRVERLTPIPVSPSNHARAGERAERGGKPQ